MWPKQFPRNSGSPREDPIAALKLEARRLATLAVPDFRLPLEFAMNRLIAHIALATGLAASATSLAADEPADQARELFVDCATRALPSQAAVGELLGQQNIGQVYSARSRMMVEVSRACQREGVTQVRLVLQTAQSHRRMAQRKSARQLTASAQKQP
jgi:hypothetical protein